jgi:hypothetical protein
MKSAQRWIWSPCPSSAVRTTLAGSITPALARRQPLAPQPIDLSAMLPEFAGLLRRTLGEHIEVRVIDTRF